MNEPISPLNPMTTTESILPHRSACMSLITFAYLIGGPVLLVVGAEALVRGAARLASRFGIPPLIIGLTVVAFGTSAPETAVSVQASLGGSGDIAVGNVIGSNIANILLILGLSALIAPLVVSRQLIRLDVPVMIGAGLLCYALARNGSISRLDGALLLISLIGYTLFLVAASKREKAPAGDDEFATEFGPDESDKPFAWVFQLLLILLGLGLLVGGSNLLIEGAVGPARALGLSELVIGLTVVAVGTSMPELATSVLAVIKGERDIAVGNVVGSCIFNLLLVLGAGVAVAPCGLSISPNAQSFDFPVMLAVFVACLPIFFSGYCIRRWEGLLFFAYYVAYTLYRSCSPPGSAPSTCYVMQCSGSPSLDGRHAFGDLPARLAPPALNPDPFLSGALYRDPDDVRLSHCRPGAARCRRGGAGARRSQTRCPVRYFPTGHRSYGGRFRYERAGNRRQRAGRAQRQRRHCDRQRGGQQHRQRAADSRRDGFGRTASGVSSTDPLGRADHDRRQPGDLRPAWDGELSRIDGALLFAAVVAYTLFLIISSRREKAAEADDEFAKEFGLHEPAKPYAGLINAGLVIAGLVLLVVGSNFLVEGAVALARALGLSELVIGLTVIAIGTSLPELATSIMAAFRGERDIAVGNIVGSNIFNLLCVLGLASLVSPQAIGVSSNALAFDFPVMIAVAVACLPIFFAGYCIKRWEGALFLAYYVAYTLYRCWPAPVGHSPKPLVMR